MRGSLLKLVMALSLAVGTGKQMHAEKSFGVDLHGHTIHELAGEGTRVVVLIFAASDCPISNRYVPEIARLGQKFAGKEVKFWWVFPNPDDVPDVVTRHNREYRIPDSGNTATLLDRSQSTVRMAHVTTTPEAAVFAVRGNELREIYHGRIDDRYIALGKERPTPQHHELEEAIEAAISGQPIPQPDGPPVGCSIVYLQK